MPESPKVPPARHEEAVRWIDSDYDERTGSVLQPDYEEEEETVLVEDKKPSEFQAAADKAVLGMCEMLGLLFGLPFGEDLYHDRPFSEISAWHWLYLAIGIFFAGAGFMFPWIRTRTWVPERTTASLSRAALDARFWIAGLLLLFAYSEIYLRATAPISQDQSIQRKLDEAHKLIAELRSQLQTVQTSGIPQVPHPAANPTNQGSIVWNHNGQFFIGTGSGPDTLIHSVLLQGTSVTMVTIKEAFAVSGLTGHKQELMANAPNRGYFPVDKVDIPPQASVWLELLFKPPLLIRDFLDEWGKFRVTIRYENGTVYEHEFDDVYIRQKVQQEIPGSGPRVTPRESK